MLRGTRFPALPTLVVFRNPVVTMNLFRHLMLTRILACRGLLMVGLFALHSVTLADTRVRLTRDGKPLASIVTAARPSPSARLAALEIQSHVQRISGATLPIVSDDTPFDGVCILVGESARTRELGLRGADFKPQEYLIAFRPRTVVLIGRDWEDTEANRKVEGRPMTGENLDETRHRIHYATALGLPADGKPPLELPGLYDDQGTCLATYDFLERHCGVRWYGPAPLNVIVPTEPSLSVKGSDLRRSPALKHRSDLPSGSWPFLQNQWGPFTREQVHLHWRRTRQGGEPWSANHTFYPRTIKGRFHHPDYQPKNAGTHVGQLCYTSPRLVEEVAQTARDYFDGKGQLPEGWKALGDYFAVVPDDTMHLCNCEACKAARKPGEGRKTGFFSDGVISDYWFSFVNAIAREVRKTHPDKYIATLAYWSYALPPSFDIEPNVSVSPCLHTCYYPVHPGMTANDLDFYEAWRRKTKAPMFLWVYYHHPMEPALIDGFGCFPHVMVHDTAKAMRRFIQDGIHGIFECGEQDQLEQYVMTKVWDDSTTDVDGTIDEFFRLYFGRAGKPMNRFYRRLEEIACDPKNYPAPYLRTGGIDWKKVAWERLGTAERMEELGRLIQKAESLAETDAEKQRVAQWRKAFWDWMVRGREKALAQEKPARK